MINITLPDGSQQGLRLYRKFNRAADYTQIVIKIVDLRNTSKDKARSVIHLKTFDHATLNWTASRVRCRETCESLVEAFAMEDIEAPYVQTSPKVRAKQIAGFILSLRAV